MNDVVVITIGAQHGNEQIETVKIGRARITQGGGVVILEHGQNKGDGRRDDPPEPELPEKFKESRKSPDPVVQCPGPSLRRKSLPDFRQIGRITGSFRFVRAHIRGGRGATPLHLKEGN